MQNLWAPWRMKYILSIGKTSGCIFCQKWTEEKDEENLLVYRGERCFIILNLFPYNSGHLMVAPARHTAEIGALSETERLEMWALAERSVGALRAVVHPDGFNIGMNLGRVAGAGIEDHLHLHVVPRWNGDTNFMPVIGDAKVISEGLEETCRKLRAAMGAARG